LKDFFIAFFMMSGSIFMLLSAIGIVRMPDLFTRMHAATKVGTVGIICIVTAVAIYFEEMKVVAPTILIILFFLATAPVAAHMIGRAAYLFGVPLWRGTVVDEWRGKTEIVVRPEPVQPDPIKSE
jgi:multicomponent Na+:H+ antiporter subunit G